MAVTAPQPRKITADEFFALPGEQKHTQLIDGEIVVNAPSMRHQEVLYWLAYELETFRRAHPGAGKPGLEADLPAGEFDVYVPDLWWATPDRMPGDRFEAMPDLAIEVRSPSTWHFDTARSAADTRPPACPSSGSSTPPTTGSPCTDDPRPTHLGSTSPSRSVPVTG